MNPAVALFFAFVLAATTAAAQEPPHLSEKATAELYERVQSQRRPQQAVSPDQRFRAVYRQTRPGVYGRNSGRVTILDRRGRVLASRVLTEHGGRLVAVARWSPDSKFCVFTTISAGGHSPWQFEPYVFSAASRRFRFLGDGSFEAVINPDFHFAAPATVLFATRQGIMPLPLGASVDPAQAHWSALLRRVRVGMSRAGVKQLLDHAEASEADRHTALYLLDAH